MDKKYRLVLSAVHMVYRLVNTTYHLKELTLRMTRLLCQFIHASSAGIYLLDPTHKRVESVAVFNNQINVYLDKKKDLQKIPENILKVTKGMSIFEKYMIGLPLIAEDIVGAIIIQRKKHEPPFTDFDRDMLSVFAEQAVTAIKNLQLNDQQQNTIMSTIKFIGRLFERQGGVGLSHRPVYFKIIQLTAEKLNCNQEEIKNLEYASILHDAGLTTIPQVLLNKVGALTTQEIQMIHEHPQKSVELMKPVGFLKPLLPIIMHHHERYDGSGYPSGLRGKQIPLGARLMSIIDAFEAMIQGRPYRRAMEMEEIFDELRKNSGIQFDPVIVEVFLNLAQQKKFRKLLSLLKA